MDQEGLILNEEELPPKQVHKMMKTTQLEQLQETLCKKKIHGVFFKQCLKPGWDTFGSHGWLADGRLRADTEGLIFVAQDGVLLTRTYQARVMKADVPISCKVCKQALETINRPPVVWV